MNLALYTHWFEVLELVLTMEGSTTHYYTNNLKSTLFHRLMKQTVFLFTVVIIQKTMV